MTVKLVAVFVATFIAVLIVAVMHVGAVPVYSYLPCPVGHPGAPSTYNCP